MKLAVLNDVVFGYASAADWPSGGAERYQWLLARALAAEGWTVTVGVRKWMKPREHRVIDGVQFVGIESGHILKAWHRFLASERPDWWHWQCADRLWGLGVGIAKAVGVKTVFGAQVDRDVQPRLLIRHNRWWPLYAWGLARTDRILVQHRGQLDSLQPHLRRKASILPGIVDSRPAFRSHVERERYVAWAAMLRTFKRADLLIEIARRLPHVRFVVCGGPTTFLSPPGYGEQMVSALQAQPNIEYLGKVAPAKSIEIIANASLLLSTSDEEGFPSTFLEAWAGGTPVISLKLDPDSLIQKHQLGAVPGSIENTVQAVAELMDAPALRDEIAVRSRQYIASTHTGKVVAQQFQQAILAS